MILAAWARWRRNFLPVLPKKTVSTVPGSWGAVMVEFDRRFNISDAHALEGQWVPYAVCADGKISVVGEVRFDALRTLTLHRDEFGAFDGGTTITFYAAFRGVTIPPGEPLLVSVGINPDGTLRSVASRADTPAVMEEGA